VREIGDAFPGWHVWYSDWSHTWNAHRKDAKPYFGPVVGPAFMVSAYSAAKLVTLLEDQVRIDIAAEFPDWRVSQIAAGGWHAVGHGQADGGSVTRIVGHATIVGLHAALRDLTGRKREAVPSPRSPRIRDNPCHRG
jgi:hypothetical protein